MSEKHHLRVAPAKRGTYSHRKPWSPSAERLTCWSPRVSKQGECRLVCAFSACRDRAVSADAP
eukprot:3208825-Pleurochrysis_carterae.AAC.5